MIALDTRQAQLASRASAQMVTLLVIDTFSDYVAQTLDERFYFASVPILYKWNGTDTVQFRGPLAGVSSIDRGFDHIPDASVLSSRDGMRATFDASEWAGEFPWNDLTAKNLIGAHVTVASLLVEWPEPRPDTWQDQSALGAVHTVRFRGEVTAVAEYDDEENQFEIVFDSLEPVLPWPVAMDTSEVSEQDLGKTYPVPVGDAKRIPLVQRRVGWVTTLTSQMTPTTIGTIFVSDATGFPDSPATFAIYIGSERLLAQKLSAISIDVLARGYSVGAVSTVANSHRSGAVIIEEIESAAFVYAGVPTRGITALYALSPHTGDLVLVPAQFYGFHQADYDIDPGHQLGAVTFTGQGWAEVIAHLNREARVDQQPEFGDASDFRYEASANEASYSLALADTDMIVSAGSVEARYSGSVDEAGGFYWLSGDLASQTDVVVRYRIHFDYRIRSSSGSTSRGRVRADNGFLNVAFAHHELLLNGQPERSESVITEWFDVPGGTTVADMVNHATAFDSAGPMIRVTLDTGTGTPDADNQFQVDALTVELEIAGQTITRTVDTVTSGAQEIGFNLELFADVLGAVTLGSESSESEFDSSSGWAGSGVTFSDVGGGGGFNAIADSTLIERTSALLGISPALDVSAHRFKFDYQLDAGTYGALELTDRAFQVQLVSSGSDDITYGWPRSSLHVGAWTTFCFDPQGSGPQIIESNGTIDFSNVSTIRLIWRTNLVADGGTVSYRDLRLEARTYNQHPIDVAQWLIEESAGISGGADASTFSTAKTNLPSVVFAGDLRNAGQNLAEVLARIGFECRTNFVPSESATQTVFKAFNALATYAFSSSVRTLAEFRSLRTRMKLLDEQATEFVALFDFRNQHLPGSIEGYAGLLQANATTNDISSDVPTVDITDAQDRVGVRQNEPLGFFLVPNQASIIEVFAYYVQEALRGDAKRHTASISFPYGYDLEPGDIVEFQPRWSSSTLKCRVIRTVFAFDSPSVGVSLEEVL